MLEIFDQILIVDGGTTDHSFDDPCLSYIFNSPKIRIIKRDWPESADWDYLTEQYNFGLQNLTTDWRVKIDADYIFHENDIPKIKELLQREDVVGYTFEKSVFTLIDRFRSKTKTVLAVNTKLNDGIFVNDKEQFQCGDVIYTSDNILASGIRVYVYDHCFKTKENISDVMYKFAKAAYEKNGTNWGHESRESALKFVVDSNIAKVENYPQNMVKYEDQPKFIKPIIDNMEEYMSGYSLFGYKKASYFGS
jgi:hypothetical protein